MRKKRGMCVEINRVFYESLRLAGRVMGHDRETIKKRCLSDDYPNYEIVPFQITCTKKRCTVCEKMKLLKEFGKQGTGRGGINSKCKECCKKYSNKRYKDNPEHSKEYSGQPEVKARNNKRLKEKRETDIAFKVNSNMSCAIRKVSKG